MSFDPIRQSEFVIRRTFKGEELLTIVADSLDDALAYARGNHNAGDVVDHVTEWKDMDAKLVDQRPLSRHELYQRYCFDYRVDPDRFEVVSANPDRFLLIAEDDDGDTVIVTTPDLAAAYAQAAQWVRSEGDAITLIAVVDLDGADYYTPTVSPLITWKAHLDEQ